MHKGERLRFVAIVGVAIAVLSAGFALAGDAFDAPTDEPTSTCEPRNQASPPSESKIGAIRTAFRNAVPFFL